MSMCRGRAICLYPNACLLGFGDLAVAACGSFGASLGIIHPSSIPDRSPLCAWVFSGAGGTNRRPACLVPPAGAEARGRSSPALMESVDAWPLATLA